MNFKFIFYHDYYYYYCLLITKNDFFLVEEKRDDVKSTEERSQKNFLVNEEISFDLNYLKIIIKLLVKELKFFIRNYYSSFKNNLLNYRELITGNRLTNCTWNYVVKKFWMWVDEAPTD